jgi:Methylase involved in ubiquinone/menaquinone biosynthesis
MNARQAFFNQSAIKWDNQFGTPQLTQSLIEMVPKFNLKKGQKILDLGTGTGVLIPHLVKAVGPSGNVTAVDYAEKMVELCRIKNASILNVTVLLGDVENLQFLAETFDAVTCFGLFPHLENKAKALQQINRVLIIGGKLIIAHALSSQEIKRHHQNAPPAVASDELPESQAMCEMLTKAGFIDVTIVDAPGCYLCSSTKAYMPYY